MKVELLHIAECPNRHGARYLLKNTLRELGLPPEVDEIEVRRRVFRIAGHCELIGAASLVQLTARQQNVAAVEVRARAAWIRRDRGVITSHGFVDPPLLLERVSFVDQREYCVHGSSESWRGRTCRVGQRL